VKFSKGDLVFDPRLNMAGMIMDIEERVIDRMSVPIPELWYRVMLFGDHWCKEGKTRDYVVKHGDDILEAYNEEVHKGLSRDEAEHNVDEISQVFFTHPKLIK